MSSEYLLTLSGLEAAHLGASTAARARRDELISAAKQLPQVADTTTADQAGKCLVKLKEFSREIESARKTVKAPVIELAREIDALSSELTLTVENEAARLGKLLGAWQAMQAALAREQARKAAEAEAHIRREREEAERIAQEKLRQEQAELAAKAARARTVEGKERAELELAQAERRAAEEQQARTDAAAAAIVAEQAKVTTVAPKPEGIATRTELCFEVTDIVALYEAAPYLVKLEPNVAGLKSALKALRRDQTLPGVRHWYEAKSIVR